MYPHGISGAIDSRVFGVVEKPRPAPFGRYAICPGGCRLGGRQDRAASSHSIVIREMTEQGGRCMTASIETRRVLLAGAAGLLLASHAMAEMVPLTISPDAPSAVPEPFANKDVDIAVVRQAQRRRCLSGLDLRSRGRGREARRQSDDLQRRRRQREAGAAVAAGRRDRARRHPDRMGLRRQSAGRTGGRPGSRHSCRRQQRVDRGIRPRHARQPVRASHDAGNHGSVRQGPGRRAGLR